MLFANALGLGGFTLLLAGTLCVHFGFLLANTFIGTFVIHATFPLVAAFKGSSTVYAALPFIALLEVFGALLPLFTLSIHFGLLGSNAFIRVFVIHTALPLVAALDIHLTLLLANTFIGTFVIHATFPLVATLDIHLTLLLGDAFAGLCAPASLKSTLRQNQGIPAFARLSIGALARRPLIVLISRVFLRRVEIAVLVFTAFVAHKFSGIVSVTSPFASLTMGDVIPIIHCFAPFCILLQFTFALRHVILLLRKSLVRKGIGKIWLLLPVPIAVSTLLLQTRVVSSCSVNTVVQKSIST